MLNQIINVNYGLCRGRTIVTLVAVSRSIPRWKYSQTHQRRIDKVIAPLRRWWGKERVCVGV
jgi:hypothetical protein